jgi:hypothetical protein
MVVEVTGEARKGFTKKEELGVKAVSTGEREETATNTLL